MTDHDTKQFLALCAQAGELQYNLKLFEARLAVINQQINEEHKKLEALKSQAPAPETLSEKA